MAEEGWGDADRALAELREHTGGQRGGEVRARAARLFGDAATDATPGRRGGNMTELLLRGPAADEMIARRRQLGIDTYDEMWDGVYHVTPVGSAEHADLQAGLIGLLRASHRPGIIGVGPINLGNERNYRVPDAAVIDVVHRSLVWVPSALLVGEVLSPGDDTYEKFDHYEAHGVDEILVVDPRRQCVEIWQRQELGGYAKSRYSVLLTGRSDDLIWAQVRA